MAVSAPNVALLDLGAHGSCRGGVDEAPDIVTLDRRIAVIELKHERVCFAAIDAGMISQVFGDQSPIARAIECPTDPVSTEIGK